MTDFEKFKELYEKVGIAFNIDPRYDATPTVTLEAQTSYNLIGYGGFATALSFDEEGNFLRQDIFE